MDIDENEEHERDAKSTKYDHYDLQQHRVPSFGALRANGLNFESYGAVSNEVLKVA